MTLRDFFSIYPRVALGFSGGVDSSYLLWEAKAAGAQIGAYYVSTAFQPAFEREDAMRFASFAGVTPTVIELDILSCEEVTANPADRCYYCKKRIFGAVAKKAMEDGYTVLIDGTNASDDIQDRPGMRALEELRVMSPLRMCGLTKEEIRRQSKEAGLFIWDKPAYACLATRIPAGTQITAEDLQRTEKAETTLRDLGFSDFRIRCRGGNAVIEVTQPQMLMLIQKQAQIAVMLKNLGYRGVLLNKEYRKPSL